MVEPEAETEPDAVVPETKEHTDGESGGEQGGAATLVQVEEAATTEASADTEILVRDAASCGCLITGLLWGQTS